MARKRPRANTQEQESPTLNSLAARANRLRELVRQRAQRDQQAGIAQGLQTRREELREVVQSSERLAEVLSILRAAEITVNFGPMAFEPGERFTWQLSVNGETQRDWQVSFQTEAAAAPGGQGPTDFRLPSI